MGITAQGKQLRVVYRSQRGVEIAARHAEKPQHPFKKHAVRSNTSGLLAPPGRYHTSESLYQMLSRNSTLHLQEGVGRGFYLSSNKLF